MTPAQRRTTVQSFFDAIASGNVAAMQAALLADPTLVFERDGRHPTLPWPLHTAAGCAEAGPARLLIERGCPVDAVDLDGTTALGEAAFRGHPLVVEALLLAKPALSVCNRFGFTPLAAALAGEQNRWRHYSRAPREDWHEAVRLLREAGAT